MQRLSGLDAAFLAIETPNAHMHVLSAAVVDPATAPNGFSFDLVRELLLARLHLLPPFRRRLVSVPFDLHYPLWLEDPDFDIDFHLRRSALPNPGGPEELAAFTAECAARPLDRSRPLWEMWYVEGVEGDKVGLITKVHHAAIDGMSGTELIAALYDLEPTPTQRLDVEIVPEVAPDHVPNDVELIAFAAASIARQPLLIAKNLRKTVRSAVRVANRVRGSNVRAGVPLTAPRITLNGSITPHRKIAFADVSLTDIKKVKDAFGVKVNDVVLAIATGAMRTYLAERGELPDRPLVATIPTSVRTPEQKTSMGNRVSAMFAALPVELEDPLDRLHAIQESTIEAKEIHEDIGGETLQDWAEVVAPAIFSRAMKAYSSLRLADRHRPVHNLVVSNVPGPPFPIYFGGARLESFYPLGPIFDGAGLNLTVISYLDSVGFGFLACRELAPDIDRLAAAVTDALEELVKLATAGIDIVTLDDTTAAVESVMDAVRPRRPAAEGASGFDRVAPRHITGRPYITPSGSEISSSRSPSGPGK
jgi:WS/DGAT/MGAT family acyltransferase